MEPYPLVESHGLIGDLQTAAPSGEQVGNFPPAFSHLSLINTATILDAMLDAPQ